LQVREFSVENLYFMLDIEEYRKLSGLDEKREKVRQLYNNYIRPGSPFELSTFPFSLSLLPAWFPSIQSFPINNGNNVIADISSPAREEAMSGSQYWMGGKEHELEKTAALSGRETVGFSPLFEEEDESHVAPIDHIFDRAVQEILHTLRTDSFPRFLQSETYDNMPSSLKFAGIGSHKVTRRTGPAKTFSV
jgi:hypothetical protein